MTRWRRPREGLATGRHLMRDRTAQVDDWSWQRTRRRLGMLVRYTRPYRTRTLFSIGSLLLATVFALAPPLLSKYAVDDGIRQHDLGKLWWIVGAFLLFGLLSWGMSYVQTYLTGWVGERILADLRNSLFDHLQDLSLGFYERNRAGVIISRLTNDVEAIDQLVTDGVTSPRPRTRSLCLAPRSCSSSSTGAGTRDAGRDPVHEHRDGDLPQALRPRVRVRARAARPRDGHARRGHRGDADRPGVHARAGKHAQLPRGDRALPRSEHGDGRPQRALLPVRRPALDGRARRGARLRRPPLLPGGRHAWERCSPSCSTCRTSSTRCSSSRSCTALSSRPRLHWTRSSTCSTPRSPR